MVFYQELELVNVLFVKFQDVEAQLLALTVAEDVKIPGLSFKFNVLDQPNAEKSIDINLLLCLGVNEEAIISRGNDKGILVVIDIKVGGLPV